MLPPAHGVDNFPAEQVFGAAIQGAIDMIGQETKETEAIITITRQEIEELRTRQALTESVLKNLLCSSHGKPAATTLVTTQDPSKIPFWINSLL